MYKLHLILKYLRRRKIAWVSLAAVTLCTAMVIVVISVMGGWLRMFEDSARGMTGDILVKSDGLSGFPYYEEIIAEVKKLPIAVAAVPQIKSYGLVNIGYDNQGRKTEGVQVFGLPIEEIGLVNAWPESLYIQHTAYLDAKLKPPEKKTFDLRTDTSAFIGRVPPSAVDPLTTYLNHLPWGDALARHCFNYIPHPLGDGTDPNWQRLFFVPYQASLIF
ncbi:MAG: putative rane protein, partial [Thermoleophilia bacterium]|nr:putative rane protein [Thermoleophilia bacterium]